jgi:hypothetical protein
MRGLIEISQTSGCECIRYRMIKALQGGFVHGRDQATTLVGSVPQT